MLVCTIAQGMINAFPNVCKTPFPPAPPVPIPYPSISQLQMAQPVSTKVMVCGVPALFKPSKIELTNGDTPGLAGGVVSGSFMQKCEFKTGSFLVSFECKPAVRMGDPATSNKANTIGFVMVPSQMMVDAN